MSAELLSLVSTQMNLTPKLGILVALLWCLSVQSAASDSQFYQLRSTEETFNFLDQDENGTVSRNEYVEAYMKDAEPWLRIKTLMESGGGHMLGSTSYDHEIKKKRFAKIRFWRMDSDRDDVLSREEFESFLDSEDSEVESDQEALFPELDKDKDGTLSYEEFKKETDRQYSLRLASRNSRGTDSTTNEVADKDVAGPEEEAIKISSHLLTQEKKRIEKKFESTDMNGDLVLTIDEFMSWQRYSEIHSELKDVSVEAMDNDNDDAISLDEFNANMKTRLHERVAANDKIESKTERLEAHSALEQRLVRIYKYLDSNDDEQVTQSEIDEYHNPGIVVTPSIQL